jgi:hypothetical protein
MSAGLTLLIQSLALTLMKNLARHSDGEDQVGGKIMAGVKCSRCTKRGNFAAVCKAEIYWVICDKQNEHGNHKCPILKMPRPVAHAVGYAVHGLGFYHIPRPPFPRTKKDSRMALISIEGGSSSVGGGEEAASEVVSGEVDLGAKGS